MALATDAVPTVAPAPFSVLRIDMEKLYGVETAVTSGSLSVPTVKKSVEVAERSS
jgi:hypothetical protein